LGRWVTIPPLPVAHGAGSMDQIVAENRIKKKAPLKA